MENFRTNYNSNSVEYINPEETDQVSLTQPDHTYKIRDIIKRAEAGMFIPTIEGDYDEEGRLEVVRRAHFDLTDIDEIKSNISKMKDLTKELEAVKKQKEADAAEAALRVKIQEESVANKEAEQSGATDL